MMKMPMKAGKGDNVKETGRHVKEFGLNSTGSCLQSSCQITLESGVGSRGRLSALGGKGRPGSQDSGFYNSTSTTEALLC